MFGRPRKPIKPSYHNRIELPLAGVVHEFVQFGA
jgi:hypothetical protein